VVSRYEREYVVGFGGIKTLGSQGYGKWRVMHYDIKGCTQAQCITWIHTSSPHLSKSIPDAVSRRGPDENNEKQEKTLNIGEPTPEQCDEAVVDLSSAKAKAKKVQEVQNKEASILTKIWSFFLGIGPMLKAIASMSR
jgi:LETM1 and EF-hand domain-containing protein 1